jgi:hypothetical protein
MYSIFPFCFFNQIYYIQSSGYVITLFQLQSLHMSPEADSGSWADRDLKGHSHGLLLDIILAFTSTE